MKIITIIGARPQFVKAAIVSHYIRQHNASSSNQIEERILHTGQHYDYNMSQVFFEQMDIPTPSWHLGCTGSVEEMRDTIIPIIQGQADYIMVYGDTNSTLAGALAAEACQIPLIHIEAGLRSYNNAMVEEHNRIETDKRSSYLFCPTSTAVANLQKEGRTEGVYHVGDVMYDATLYFAERAEQHSHLLEELQIVSKGYYLATIHRAETTDQPEQLANILRAFAQIDKPIILPLHPRTRKVIEASEMLTELVRKARALRIIASVSYVDMLVLEKHAAAILTDSGGVQKEAYFHRTPCITMRQETEWTETVNTGWNTLVGTDTNKILQAVAHTAIPDIEISEYGTGKAALTIIDILCQSVY
jgi:UDP-GlcNAc3NAcA epimerase